MATLLVDVQAIRDETIPNANTAVRVGTALENIVNGVVLTPPALVANVDDYNPAGLDTATHIRVEATGGGGDRRISGLQAPPAGDNRLVTFIAFGVKDFNFRDNDPSSLAANRFLNRGGNNISLTTDENTITYWYDHITSRWRQVYSV